MRHCVRSVAFCTTRNTGHDFNRPFRAICPLAGHPSKRQRDPHEPRRLTYSDSDSMPALPRLKSISGLATALAAVAVLQAQFAWLGCGVAPSKGSGSPRESTTALTLAGHVVDPLAHSTNRAVVLIFLSTECPICNKYAPEIRKLVSKYRPKGIEFFSVYPNPDESSSDISQHLREYDLPTIPLRDPEHRLVRHSQATVTPEAVVFLQDGRIAYRGRINDKFPRLGVERPEATQQDLAKVLEAITTSNPIPSTSEPAVGCYIAPRHATHR